MKKAIELSSRKLGVKELPVTWILGFLLLAFCSPSARAQALIEAFSLDQISFAAAYSGNVPCSEYGHASFAVRQIPGQVQYVQVMGQLAGATGSPAWIVRNVPAVGRITIESTNVDLTQLGVSRGTCIKGSTVAYNITVTDSPLSAAPSFTAGRTAVVGQRIDRAEGEIPTAPFFPGTLAAPGPPAPVALQGGLFQAAGDLSVQIIEREGIGNVVQGPNECAPAAVANSMHWLQASGSVNLGKDTDAQSLAKLKSDMQPNGWTGSGVSTTQILEGKLRFAQRAEHTLNLDIHYQADSTLTNLGASVTVGTGTANRNGNGGPPPLEYLKQEMQKGQDVELNIDWLNPAGEKTGGHVVTVSGMASGPDATGVWFSDDTQQNGQPGGLRTNHWAKIENEGRYMKLGGIVRNRIKAIYVESPKPSFFLTLIPLEDANKVEVDAINFLTAGAAVNAASRSPLAAAVAGTLTPVPGSPFPAGSKPVASATASGRFAYVVNFGSNNISGYKIDPGTGALTPITGSPFATGPGPFSIAVDPSGRFAYVGNSGSTTVSAYAIDPITGVLTTIAGSPFPAGAQPSSVAVGPSGRLLHVTNIYSNNISAYTIDGATGALTPVPGSPFAAGSFPNSVAVDPTGRFAYVANASFGQSPGTVSAFAIGANGALTPIMGSPFAGGSQPVFVAIEPTGKFAYVANSGSNNVSAYAIDATTGALTPVPGSPFAAGTGLFSVAADPTGQFLYVTGQTSGSPGTISAFSINPTTGALTPVSGSPFPSNQGPGPARMTTATVLPVSTSSNPVPSIALLAPSVAKAGGATFTLTLYGNNFVPGAAVRWNGSNRTTAFVSSSQLNVAIPAGDLATAGTAQVTVVNPAPGGGASNSLAFTVSAPSASIPALPPGGTVNAAGFQAGVAVAPGSIAAVFGSNMASQTQGAVGLPLPTTLGGTSLLFNAAAPAPLFYTSAGQVNMQVPWELAGQTRALVTVTAGGGTSAPAVINLAPFAPGIFATNNSGSGQGAVLISSTGEFAAPSGSITGAAARPAKKGEFLTIYCTGLGDVTNRPANGVAASADPLSTTTAAPTVTIGGVSATVSFSGLAPGFVGLYQVNVQVPDAAPTGNTVLLVLSIGGLNSNTVTIAVQ